jgi:hypothetical protein
MLKAGAIACGLERCVKTRNRPRAADAIVEFLI